MAFEKNNKLSKGRPKGAMALLTNDLREMILIALDKAGGSDYLFKQAIKNPVAFLALIAKLLPKDINVSAAVSHTLKNEPVPEFNRWLASIATNRDADKEPPTLPN